MYFSFNNSVFHGKDDVWVCVVVCVCMFHYFIIWRGREGRAQVGEGISVCLCFVLFLSEFEPSSVSYKECPVK